MPPNRCRAHSQASERQALTSASATRPIRRHLGTASASPGPLPRLVTGKLTGSFHPRASWASSSASSSAPTGNNNLSSEHLTCSVSRRPAHTSSPVTATSLINYHSFHAGSSTTTYHPHAMSHSHLTDMDNEKQLGLGTPGSESPPPVDTTHTTDPPARAVEPPPDGGLKAWMTIAGTFVSAPLTAGLGPARCLIPVVGLRRPHPAYVADPSLPASRSSASAMPSASSRVTTRRTSWPTGRRTTLHGLAPCSCSC